MASRPQSQRVPSRALTVLPPWSWWIASEDRRAKRIENRTWIPSALLLDAGDRLAIHSGVRECMTTAEVRAERDARGWPDAPLTGPKGAIVATATVYFPSPSAVRSPWAEPGARHWELCDVVVLPRPVPCRGAQGLWRIPDEVAERMARQLADLIRESEARHG